MPDRYCHRHEGPPVPMNRDDSDGSWLCLYGCRSVEAADFAKYLQGEFDR